MTSFHLSIDGESHDVPEPVYTRFRQYKARLRMWEECLEALDESAQLSLLEKLEIMKKGWLVWKNPVLGTSQELDKEYK